MKPAISWAVASIGNPSANWDKRTYGRSSLQHRLGEARFLRPNGLGAYSISQYDIFRHLSAKQTIVDKFLTEFDSNARLGATIPT